MKKVVRPWRSEGQERAFVRFETAPGEQAQMDWGHFGNFGGKRLYGFALTLCWSRMQYLVREDAAEGGARSRMLPRGPVRRAVRRPCRGFWRRSRLPSFCP